MRDSYMFYKDKLSKEYRTVFDQVEMFAMSQNVNEAMLEERLGELLDIFLAAQEAGKPILQITGNNIEKFCKTFCSDFNIKNRILHILDWFKSIAKILVFISILELIFAFFETEKGTFDPLNCVSSLNLSGYIIGILISGIFAMIANIILRRIMFKTKRMSMILLRAVSCAVAILSFLLIFLLWDNVAMFNVPVWRILVLSCLYLLLYYLLYGRNIKRHKIRFSDVVRDQIRKDMSKEMSTKYEKVRKKSLKKGKGELTFEAFLDNEEKECIKFEKTKYFYYLFPLVLIIVFTLGTYFTDGFDSVWDMAIFVSILAVLEYPLMLGFWKLFHTGFEERLAWIREKRNDMKKEENDEII